MQVCRCERRCVQVCVGVRGYVGSVRECLGVHGYAWVYAGVCESARVCSGVRRYARVYASVRRYLQVCMENCGIHFYYISKYVCADVQEHARVCSVCTGVHVPGKFYYSMCLIKTRF